MLLFLDFPEVMFGLQTLVTDVTPSQELLACALLYKNHSRFCQILLKAWSENIPKALVEGLLTALEKDLDVVTTHFFPKDPLKNLFAEEEAREDSWLVGSLKGSLQRYEAFKQSIQEYRALLKLPNAYVYV